MLQKSRRARVQLLGVLALTAREHDVLFAPAALLLLNGVESALLGFASSKHHGKPIDSPCGGDRRSQSCTLYCIRTDYWQP